MTGIVATILDSVEKLGVPAGTNFCVAELALAGALDLAAELERLLSEATPSDRLILAVRRRIEAFTKAQLLGEIFSSSRLERIKSVMGAGNGK